MALYEPAKTSLGQLPEFDQDVQTYDMKLPDSANEVLIYTFVTTSAEGEFQRGYYEISTTKDGKQFTQYMNVATGQGVKAVNSSNMWFPKGDGKLSIKLVHGSEKKTSIKGKVADWSEVFIIGYR
mmetsp:Transcript_64083/g.102016  ORF Transcript_64083/g.102016 Transcript_64083/m.102016 type:complete len:125 (-) Transcript_64083:375-749(-)